MPINNQNLQKLAEVLVTVKDKDFDMKKYYDPKTNKYCLSGLMYKTFSNGEPLTGDYQNDMEKADRFRREFLFPETDRQLTSYLFGEIWANWEETNTVECALYRIKKILDGHIPGDIFEERNQVREALTVPYQ